MNNITYDIIETENNNSDNDSPNYKEIPLNKKSKLDDTILEKTFTDLNNDVQCAREIDYDLNYSVKYLTAILEFYGIKKGKLNKKEIIEKIIEFEFDTCIDNISIVENRKRLFDNFAELKNDKYFNKFIIGNLF